MNLLRQVAIACAVFVLLSQAPAYAACFVPCPVPIPIGTTSADDLIINFDFSSSVPAPPYDAMNAQFSFSGWDAGETLTFDLYADLDGSGGFVGSLSAGGPSFNVIIANNDPDWLDGLFSVGVRLDEGAADLSTATGLAIQFLEDGRPEEIRVTGTTISQVAVPEPGTLALLGIALAGLAFRRRKRA